MKVLLVEDNPGDARLLELTLQEVLPTCGMKHVISLAEASMQVTQEQYDIVLLDLSLPDASGDMGFRRMHDVAPTIPVIVLTGLDDEDMAAGLVQAGAQDFLVKGTVDGRQLLRAIRYAIERKRTESALRQSEAKNRALLEAIPDMLLSLDHQCTFIECKVSPESLPFLPPEQFLGRTIYEVMPPATACAAMACLQRAATEHQAQVMEFSLELEGKQHYYEARFVAVDDDGVLCIMRDITARQRAETELRLAARVFESTHEGIMVAEIDGRIVSVNDAFCDITSHDRADILGQQQYVIWDGGEFDGVVQAVRAALGQRGRWQGEASLVRSDGKPFSAWICANAVRDQHEQITHWLTVFTDISDLKESQDRLQHLAYHDPLTNLPNRMLFRDRLEHTVAQASRASHGVAVMYLDLDRFKNVNDTLGHAVGDQLLRMVAERICSCVRESDTVARLGGDEFALVLTRVENTESATLIAEKLLEALQPPFHLDQQEVFIGASIGISFYWPGQEHRSNLVEEADVAMYHAKNQGRNGYRLYAPELDAVAFDRLQLETSMRHALERNEFRLYYQPQVGIGGGRVMAVEALVRWLCPVRGLVGPDEFISLLEETGLIVQVGEWVMRTACQQARKWFDAGAPTRVAVNLSARQFKQANLPATVAGILQETGLAPRFLELELTESILMENVETNVSQLQQLKALGVSIAIDDFGTGASSLAYLKDFPVDSVKLCQSFVLNLPHNDDDKAIASAVISLAQGLRLISVAEGVENEQQAAFLRENKCDYLQGFLFSKAMPAEDMEHLLHGDYFPEPSALN